jgi:hypothetical protein
MVRLGNGGEAFDAYDPYLLISSPLPLFRSRHHDYVLGPGGTHLLVLMLTDIQQPVDLFLLQLPRFSKVLW